MFVSSIVFKLGRLFKRFGSKHALTDIYVIFFVISSLFFLISILFTKGTTFSNAFYSDKSDTFMDYFNSVRYSSDLPYTKYTIIYPALITVFYKVVGHITIPFNVSTIGNSIAIQMRNSQSALMIFSTITLVAIYLILVLLRRYFKKSADIKVELLCILLLCSYPLMYGVERGNSIIYVVATLLFYILFYNSQNKYLRYISYICLGIATGIKIYVLFFGLLILRERNYREFILCYAIVLMLFFIPFIFTDGSIYALMHNIFSYMGGASEVPGSFHNIKEFIGYFSDILTVDTRYYVQYLLFFILYVCTSVASIFGRSLELWKVITLICSACVLGMGTGAPYNFCLYLIPFSILLSKNYNPTKMNIAYVLLFTFMFIWIPASSEEMIKYIDALHFLPAYLITLLIFYEFVISAVLHKNLNFVHNNWFNDEINLKFAVLTLVVATVMVLTTSIAPYFNNNSISIDNNGQIGRIIDNGEEFTFSYNSEEYISSDGRYYWNSEVKEFLISTDSGCVSSNSVTYYNAEGQVVNAVLPSSWEGDIKNNYVTLKYLDSGCIHLVTWMYFKFAVTVSPAGDLSLYSNATESQKIYINNCDWIYGITCCNENTGIVGIVGTSVYTNGEKVGTVDYNFKKDFYYNDALLLQLSADCSIVKIGDKTETHIVEYIVPKVVYLELNVSEKELKITSLINIGIILFCIFGLIVLILDNNMRKR